MQQIAAVTNGVGGDTSREGSWYFSESWRCSLSLAIVTDRSIDRWMNVNVFQTSMLYPAVPRKNILFPRLASIVQHRLLYRLRITTGTSVLCLHPSRVVEQQDSVAISISISIESCDLRLAEAFWAPTQASEWQGVRAKNRTVLQARQPRSPLSKVLNHPSTSSHRQSVGVFTKWTSTERCCCCCYCPWLSTRRTFFLLYARTYTSQPLCRVCIRKHARTLNI